MKYRTNFLCIFLFITSLNLMADGMDIDRELFDTIRSLSRIISQVNDRYISNDDIERFFNYYDIPSNYQSIYFEKIKNLLDSGANPNIRIKEQIFFPTGSLSTWHFWAECTPIMVCLDTNVTKLLIEYGSDIDAQDDHGRTALMIHSFLKMNNAIMSILIEKNANINIKDNKGRTALNYSIQGLNIKGMQLLVNGGANVNVYDDYGRNPLIVANIRYVGYDEWGKKFRKEMVEILEEAGARLTVTDEKKISELGDLVWWDDDLYFGYADR